MHARVLLVEDNEDDSALILRALRQAGYEILAAERVASAEDLREALARQAWTLIICDYSLPGFGGLAALTLIREHHGDLPVVVVSGAIGEEATLAVVRAGADGLVSKQHLERLPGAVEQALRDGENRRRRSAAEAALREESRISAALARVGQECVASLEKTELLHRICRTTTEVLGADCTHVALWDAGEQDFVVAAGHDAAEDWERVRVLKFPMALLTEHASQLRRNGIIHIASTTAAAADSASASMVATTGMSAAVLVPLWRGADLFGFYVAGYRRPEVDFASWQRRAAVGIGHLTSLALDNAHLVDRLLRSDRVKTEFLSTMSHELRTPLNHIIGFGDILVEEAEQLTAEQSNMLQTIGRSSRDLLALVNGILDAQRLESAAAHEPVSTNVTELVRRLAAIAEKLTDDKSIRVSCELPEDMPSVRTDPIRLKAVLQNLVENAVKFTPRGSVAIRAEVQNGGILFTVADTGIGIPIDVLPIIFEPFRQGDASFTRKHGGAGLGLHIVRREVDLMGGEVTVESEVGVGSTFRVWIPSEQGHNLASPTNPIRGTPVPYAEILDATSDLVYTAGVDGRLLYTNRALREALGYEPDELRVMCFDGLAHQQSKAMLEQAHHRSVGGDAIEGLHLKCLAKDGSTVELEGSVRFHPATHTPAFIQGVFRNVSERDEAQRQSEARRQHLEAVIKALPVGVWIADATGRIVLGNSAGRRIWGAARYLGSEDSGRFKSWSAANGEQIAPEDWALARALKRGETTLDEELEVESCDGVRKSILSSAVPLRDLAGEITGAVAVNHDVTEIRRLERALWESEERFALALAGSTDGIWDWDLERNKTYYSARGRAMLGLPAESGYGPRGLWWGRLHPDDSDRAGADLLAHLDGSKPYYTSEFRLRHEDGSYVWMHVRGVALRDASGRPFRMAGSSTDISHRKEAEDELRDARVSLQSAAESAKVATWRSDLRNLTVRFSQGWKYVLGRDESEITLAASWDLMHPDDRASASAALQEHLQGRADVYENEHRMLHVDGSYRWVLSRGVVTCDSQGLPQEMYGADIDITERTELGEALRRSEEQFRNLVEDITDVVYETDGGGRMTYLSPEVERLSGYSPAEVVERSAYEFVFPDDLSMVYQQMSEAMSGHPRPYDHRILTKSGEVRWVHTSARPIFDGGEVVGLRGVLSDVTERRNAEDALRELSDTLEAQVAERTRDLVALNDQMALISENISDMVGQVNVDGVYLYVSGAHERILGYTPEQMLGTSMFDYVHPDDVARLVEARFASIEGASTVGTEFRLRHADGHFVSVEGEGAFFSDDQGAPLGAVLTARDITERKRVEAVLRESEERFSSAFEFAAIGKALFSLDGRWLKVNPAVCDFVGYAEEELLQSSFQDITHPDDLEADTAHITQLLAGGISSYQMEKRYIRKSGDVVSGWLSVSLVRDSEGEPMYFLSEVQDITERKRSEEALQTRTRQRAALAELGEAAIASTDVSALLRTAVAVISDVLDVEYCKVLELLPDGDALLLRAGVGWKEGYVGSATVETEEGSQAGYTLCSNQPVVVEDLRTETRFERAPLLTEHGVISGVSVVIPTRDRPYGVLGAHTLRQRLFSVDDINFVRTVAHLLANAIDREKTDAEIRAINVDLEERVVGRTRQLDAANRELEAFSYSVSHDLRAPLRHIDGFSLALLEDHASQLDADGVRYLKRIRTGTQHMGQLIDGLLRLSQVQRDELRRTPVDLSTLARVITEALRQATPGRSVDVVIAEDVIADGDPSLLRIVLENLLDNAWKYTGKHDTARIEFGVTQSDGPPVYFVRDDGAGVDMKFGDNLFGTFQRFHAAHEFEGSGIGLAIVRRIVRRHEGTVWATSAIEEGATFYFTLAPSDAEGGSLSTEDEGDANAS